MPCSSTRAALVNRHRPLGRDELGARYRRLRFGTDREEIESHDPIGAEWGVLDEPEWEQEGDELSAVVRRVSERLFGAIRIQTLSVPVPTSRAGPPPHRAAVEPRVLGPSAVEQALAAHYLGLPAVDPDRLLTGPGDLSGVAGFAGDHWSGRLAPAVCAVLFAPFWLRPPETWQPPEGPPDPRRAVGSFVAHTFGSRPVPGFLLDAWLGPAEELDFRWVLCSVCLARGGSLRRLTQRLADGSTGRGFRPLSRKTAAHLLEVSGDLTPTEGFVLAEVLRLGGTARELGRLRRVRGYLLDPTSLEVEDGERAHWEDTVRWLVRWGDDLTDDVADSVLRWSLHRFTEERARGSRFTWVGRTCDSVRRHAEDYARSVRVRREPHRKWTRRGWDWTCEERDATWTLVELCTTGGLDAESTAMHHCVRIYARRCIAGTAAIFSLCRDGLRVLTVEVHPGTKRIVQAQGAHNRAATATERAVLARWHREVVCPPVDSDR